MLARYTYSALVLSVRSSLGGSKEEGSDKGDDDNGPHGEVVVVVVCVRRVKLE